MSTLQTLEEWRIFSAARWSWCVMHLDYESVMRTDAYDMWTEAVKAVCSHSDYVRTGTHINSGMKRPHRRFRKFY